MFTVRPDLLATMREGAVGEFRGRLVKALRQVFPDRTATTEESELLRLADAAIERADQLGFEMEPTIWVLYAAMFVFGRDFDHSPVHKHWARKVLDHPQLNEDQVAELLALRIYMVTGVKPEGQPGSM